MRRTRAGVGPRYSPADPVRSPNALGLAIRGLTVRGYGLLIAGATLLLSGLAADVLDLRRVSILLLALPLASIVTVARNRYRVSCQRGLDPPRIEAGSSARVTLRLHNVSRLPTAVLLAEDQIPAILGGRPRFTLDRVEAGGQRAAAYTVSAPVRGRFEVGPLTVRVADPFGLCELTRAFATTEELVVSPQVMSLAPIRLLGEWTGGGEARSAAVSSVGEDDIATRPYRHGDDLRRVHWRATARIGELMVRREEQPWRNRAAVLLDSRTMAHRGVGTQSSFELAVSIAASIGVHLSRRGWAVRLLQDDGEETIAPAGAVGEGMQLNRLADVTASRGTTLGAGTARLSGESHEGMVVAICGSLNLDDVRALSRARGSGQGLAILLDVSSWSAGPQSSPRSTKAETAAARAFTTAFERLTVAGWRVLRVDHGDDFAATWPTLGLADAQASPSWVAGSADIGASA